MRLGRFVTREQPNPEEASLKHEGALLQPRRPSKPHVPAAQPMVTAAMAIDVPEPALLQARLQPMPTSATPIVPESLRSEAPSAAPVTAAPAAAVAPPVTLPRTVALGVSLPPTVATVGRSVMEEAAVRPCWTGTGRRMSNSTFWRRGACGRASMIAASPARSQISSPRRSTLTTVIWTSRTIEASRAAAGARRTSLASATARPRLRIGTGRFRFTEKVIDGLSIRSSPSSTHLTNE